ncbi:MAG: urease accessory protein UreD [Polyangiales bacterium]
MLVHEVSRGPERPVAVGKRPATVHHLVTEGLLEVSSVQAESAVTRARATSPMKLLVPRTKSEVARVSIGTYGGGLLTGDQTRLHVEVKPGAKAIVTTQSSTKVFRSVDGETVRQTLTARVHPGAVAAFIPDPVACFASARYVQEQRFDVLGNGTLFVVDWFTSGRRARGEVWAFDHYCSRQQVFLDGQRVVEDAVRLDRDDGDIGARLRGGRYHCHAVLILAGETTGPMVAQLQALAGAKPTHGPGARDLIVVANPITHGLVIRIMGEETETVARFLAREVEPRLSLFEETLWGRKF